MKHNYFKIFTPFLLTLSLAGCAMNDNVNNSLNENLNVVKPAVESNTESLLESESSSSVMIPKESDWSHSIMGVVLPSMEPESDSSSAFNNSDSEAEEASEFSSSATEIGDGTEISENNVSFDDFFLALEHVSTIEEAEALADDFGIYSSWKSVGAIRHKTYYFSDNEKAANAYKNEKGNRIIIELSGSDIKTVSYFNMSKMIAAIVVNDKIRLFDYNDPSLLNLTVSTWNDIVDYIPNLNSNLNALAKLLYAVPVGSTMNDIKALAVDYELIYDTSGKGNEFLIAYDKNIISKYAADNIYESYGSYIRVEFVDHTPRHETEDELIASLSYVYYPDYYRSGNYETRYLV